MNQEHPHNNDDCSPKPQNPLQINKMTSYVSNYGRDNLNVDDIDGAIPRKMAGYTGARPDLLVKRELEQ